MTKNGGVIIGGWINEPPPPPNHDREEHVNGGEGMEKMQFIIQALAKQFIVIKCTMSC